MTQLTVLVHFFQTPISNIDQLIKLFNKTYDRTDPQIKSEYGDEEYKDKFTKHLEKMIVLTRTDIDEVSRERERVRPPLTLINLCY